MRWLGMIVGVLAALQSPAAPVFEIRLPAEIQPEFAHIEYGLNNGRGLKTRSLVTSAGEYTYTLKFDPPIDPANKNNLKVTIYVPGYRMVASEFEGTGLTGTDTFFPQFEKLPTAHLRGLLLNSSKQPRSDQLLNVYYWLGEVGNYIGFTNIGGSILEIATVRTGMDGSFEVDVPLLRDDPFFQKYNRDLATAGFMVSGSDGGFLNDDLAFNAIPLRKSYDDPEIITTAQHGRLTGRLGPEFLAMSGLAGDLTPYLRSIGGQRLSIRLDAEMLTGHHYNYPVSLQPNGTFDVEVPPGVFDLNLKVLDPRLVRQRTVGNALVVEEGKPTVIERP